MNKEMRQIVALSAYMFAAADVTGDVGITFEFANDIDAYNFLRYLRSSTPLSMLTALGLMSSSNEALKYGGVKIGVKTAKGRYMT